MTDLLVDLCEWLKLMPVKMVRTSCAKCDNRFFLRLLRVCVEPI
jgi:hypothetical protein